MDAPPHPDAPVSPTDARLSPAQDLAVERVDLSRPAVLEEIVRLCGQALGWAAEDPNRDFFEWKHLANPFGVSHTWVARSGPDLVGVRLLLRWRLRRYLPLCPDRRGRESRLSGGCNWIWTMSPIRTSFPSAGHRSALCWERCWWLLWWLA